MIIKENSKTINRAIVSQFTTITYVLTKQYFLNTEERLTEWVFGMEQQIFNVAVDFMGTTEKVSFKISLKSFTGKMFVLMKKYVFLNTAKRLFD